MDDLLRNKLKMLYEKITETEMSNNKIALEYASLWWSHDHAYRTDDTFSIVGHNPDSGFINYIDINKMNNIALVNATHAFTFLTKRSLLIADNIIFNDIDNNSLDHYVLGFKDGAPATQVLSTSIDYEVYLRTNHIEEIGEWIKTNKEVILSGHAIYFPDIKVDYHHDNYYDDLSHYTETTALKKFNEIIHAKSTMSTIISRAFISDHYLRAIAEIEIPYVDCVNSSTVLNLIAEKSEMLSNLRLGLKERFIELDNTNGSENFDYIIKKIGIEIQNNVKEIQSELTKLKRKAFFQATGAIATSVTATLVAINGGALNNDLINSLLTYLWTGGGIISVSKFSQDYLSDKQKIKEMPFYFIWLFHKNK